MKRKRQHPKKANRSGSTMVEFAIAGPTLFIVIFIAIELTRLGMFHNLVKDASYAAARHCMVEGATEQEAVDRANSVMAELGAQKVFVQINDGRGLNAADAELKVYVEVKMKDNAFILPHLYGERVVSGTTTMRTERYLGYFDPTE